MTDEKDIVEEAKLALSYYEKDDPEWPVYLVTRLIHEVEKLRDEIEGLNEDEFGRKL